MKILVVDDAATIRTIAGGLLTNAGYDVLQAEDGEQAIKKLNEGDNPLVVDAILCDIMMPKFNGTEAIKYFRHQYPSVPVVVLTGYPDVELAMSLMRQGVMDYLIKPVTKDKLLAVISKAVGQHVILDNL